MGMVKQNEQKMFTEAIFDHNFFSSFVHCMVGECELKKTRFKDMKKEKIILTLLKFSCTEMKIVLQTNPYMKIK